MNWKKTRVSVVECFYNRTVSSVCLDQSKRAAISMNKAMEFCEALCVVFGFYFKKVNKQKINERSSKIWLGRYISAIYKSQKRKQK